MDSSFKTFATPAHAGVFVWPRRQRQQFLASLGETQGKLLASERLNMPEPSIHVRNLLETAVLQVQHSPDLTENDVRWIQQFAAHLIAEFSVLKEADVLYAPLEEEAVLSRKL